MWYEKKGGIKTKIKTYIDGTRSRLVWYQYDFGIPKQDNALAVREEHD